MNDILQPSLYRRLSNTPMRDAVRGRLTGRLDWPLAIAAAGLPDVAGDLIARVIRRARLWRTERAEVARELIAHFADGLAAGVAVDTLVADFGDEKTAAKLIRRAKRRGRPLAWHVGRWFALGGVALVFVYCVLAARFFLARPTPSVDYLAAMNAPILEIPADNRAWPIYRQVIIACKLGPRSGPDNQLPWNSGLSRPDWSAVRVWVDAHRDDIERLRQAAAKPHLGYVLGTDTATPDGGLQPPLPPRPGDPTAGMIGQQRLPYMDSSFTIAGLFAADARFARDGRDADRLKRDLVALHGMARQYYAEPNGRVFTAYIAMGLQDWLHREIERTLRLTPELFTDADLIDWSHRLAGPRTAADLVRLDGERLVTLDVVQRIYTDDGHGDGRLTLRGLEMAERFRSGRRREADAVWLREVTVPVVSSVYGSRRRALERLETLHAKVAAALARPLREQPPEPPPSAHEPADTFPRDLLNDRLDDLLSDYHYVQRPAEQTLAGRDAIQTALAMELFRRRHNDAWPASWADLVPALLPSVPTDPVTGGPLKFRVDSGRPLIYSVGGDRDDDGGRPPVYTDGTPRDYVDAMWPVTVAPDGDWPLYPTLSENELR